MNTVGNEDEDGFAEDPGEVLTAALLDLAVTDLTDPDLAAALAPGLVGTGWRVVGHRVLASPQIAVGFEVAVFTQAEDTPAYRGRVWAVGTLPVSLGAPGRAGTGGNQREVPARYALQTPDQRGETVRGLLPVEVGTAEQLVPWLLGLMPPQDLSHLPPDHPIHLPVTEPGMALWPRYPDLGWRRLQELASMVGLLTAVREQDPWQADALDVLVGLHRSGAMVADFRAAVGGGQ